MNLEHFTRGALEDIRIHKSMIIWNLKQMLKHNGDLNWQVSIPNLNDVYKINTKKS
jgi:hypothetical protein